MQKKARMARGQKDQARHVSSRILYHTNEWKVDECVMEMVVCVKVVRECEARSHCRCLQACNGSLEGCEVAGRPRYWNGAECV